jgi:hypothetical protein
MARLYPDRFPRAADQSDPELVVFELLRKLPDNYHVFYSKKFKGARNGKEECEVDFIVFNGRNCLLCIEVKGGVLEYDGAQEAWFQNGAMMSKSPDRQASAGMHEVLRFLEPNVSSVNVGWALCFPQCSLPDGFVPPPGIPAEIVIDEASLRDVHAAVVRTEEYYSQRHRRAGAAKETSREIVAKLTRGIGFVTKLGVRIASDYEQILEVTSEQFEVLEDMEVNHRVAVRGYAGSGKTLLAQEFAKRLARRGDKVLLLFFNRGVANWVRSGLDRDAAIDCTTFHSLARQLAEGFDQEWWTAAAKGDDEFWSIFLPLKLLDIPKAQLPTFDAVVVDEGQDFKKEWFEFLETLLVDGTKGRFVVFYDENQDIFNRWEGLPWTPNIALRKVLRKNCRNTKSIVDYIKRYHPCDMVSFERSPAGAKVVERRTASPDETRQLLIQDTTAALQDGVEPNQIVLLTNKSKPESCISGVESIGGYPLHAVDRSNRSGPRFIGYAGISTFKGLENDVVFLLDCEDMTEPQFQDVVYVEGSRARELLYVYRPSAFHGGVRS